MGCTICGGKHMRGDCPDRNRQLSAASVGYGALTEREKWLINEAFQAGYAAQWGETSEDWLSSLSPDHFDGETVEMALTKKAP